MNLNAISATNWLFAHPLVGITIVAWSFVWKGIALWKAAELQQKYWFIPILIFNTAGILEIIYIFFVARKYKVEVLEN